MTLVVTRSTLVMIGPSLSKMATYRPSLTIISTSRYGMANFSISTEDGHRQLALISHRLWQSIGERDYWQIDVLSND